MSSAIAGLDLVVEAATENMDIKLKIFSQLMNYVMSIPF